MNQPKRLVFNSQLLLFGGTTTNKQPGLKKSVADNHVEIPPLTTIFQVNCQTRPFLTFLRIPSGQTLLFLPAMIYPPMSFMICLFSCAFPKWYEPPSTPIPYIFCTIWWWNCCYCKLRSVVLVFGSRLQCSRSLRQFKIWGWIHTSQLVWVSP